MHRNTVSKLLAAGLAVAFTAVTIPAQAQSAGTWSVAAGAAWVVPKVDNGTLGGGTLHVHVGNDIKPTLTIEYFIFNNVGIQVLAAIPFTQKVDINGQHFGDVQHLPSVLYLQYHLTGLLGQLSPSLKNITPFVGVGVEHSFIYDEKIDNKAFLAAYGLPANSEFAVSGSTNYTFNAGVDYAIAKSNALRFDVYYANIDSNVKLNGAPIGTAHIAPFVYDISYVWNF